MNARLQFAVALVVVSAMSNASWAQAPAAKKEVLVTKADGGSIQTKLMANIVVNKESTVTREWLVVHDPSMPADLVGTPGVTTVYVRDGASSPW
jgi:predicted glycosyltransferase